MFWKKMVNFCKNANCPSSPDLLAFQSDEVSLRKNREISRHLEACEFCASEVEFYSITRKPTKKIETAEIPQPLYELARALLGNKRGDFLTLNKLFGSNEA
jgi:hypothetical protein